MKKRKTIEKLPDLQISELFLVKADWNRTFMGQIIRETTVDGQEIIRGSVIINDGKAWSVGNSEEELGNNLDDICTLKLDHNLHADPGVRGVIAGDIFFLN